MNTKNILQFVSHILRSDLQISPGSEQGYIANARRFRVMASLYGTENDDWKRSRVFQGVGKVLFARSLVLSKFFVRPLHALVFRETLSKAYQTRNGQNQGYNNDTPAVPIWMGRRRSARRKE